MLNLTRIAFPPRVSTLPTMYDNAKRRDEKDEDLLAAVSCTGVQPGVALPAFINVTQGFLVMIKMGQQC